MGLFKKILYFLGGKPPEVIFKHGQITHEHSDEKWQKWKDRFEKNPSYDFKQHVAKTKRSFKS